MTTLGFAMDTVTRLHEAVDRLDERDLRALEDSVLDARRVFVAAAGRSLLASKFFAMRLMQIGLTSFVVGEVCTPSVRDEDLVIVVSGSGETSGLIAIADKAKRAGARLGVVTEQPRSTLASMADCLLVVSTPKPEASAGELANVPHGNSLELAFIVALDAVVCTLMDRTGSGLSTLLANHANLE